MQLRIASGLVVAIGILGLANTAAATPERKVSVKTWVRAACSELYQVAKTSATVAEEIQALTSEPVTTPADFLVQSASGFDLVAERFSELERRLSDLGPPDTRKGVAIQERSVSAASAAHSSTTALSATFRDLAPTATTSNRPEWEPSVTHVAKAQIAAAQHAVKVFVDLERQPPFRSRLRHLRACTRIKDLG